MFAPAYLDYNATTPVHPAVLEAMLPFFSQRFGNASSRHEYGRAARKAVDEARERVAHALGAHPTEVIFTSSGSEANNLFIKGVAACLPPGPVARVVALSAIEHPSVREPARQLARQGWRLRGIAVDADCRVDAADFAAAMAEPPALVSVMLVNNETGAIQDIAGLAELAGPVRAWFHTDAVQAMGKLPVDFRHLNERGVHALSVSAHKVGGPKGVGALVIDKRVELTPLIAGGGHERGLRAGTENVPAIVGFGVACELAVSGLDATAARLAALRETLERGLMGAGAVIFGANATRLPNTTCFALPGIDGETLVGKLDRAGFAVASGAACSSAHSEPSYVLTAMGIEPGLARGAVRVSLGADNALTQVEDFLRTLHATLSQLTSLTALETS
ncbi:MAG: cysteine desulfurase family protein [Sulfuritalea sp.]|nr:cysteine desulfurase family protein [Sulfuritalea sp.]